MKRLLRIFERQHIRLYARLHPYEDKGGLVRYLFWWLAWSAAALLPLFAAVVVSVEMLFPVNGDAHAAVMIVTSLLWLAVSVAMVWTMRADLGARRSVGDWQQRLDHLKTAFARNYESHD